MQNPAIASCDADASLLELHLDSFVTLMSDAGYKDIHMTFVDDLLLAQSCTLQSAVPGFESTILGGLSGLSRNCACLAALFFLS